MGVETLKPRLGDLLAVCVGDRQSELEGETQALLDVGARLPILVGPLMDGREVLKIILGAYQSAGEGRKIAWPYEPPAYDKPIDLWKRGAHRVPMGGEVGAGFGEAQCQALFRHGL